MSIAISNEQLNRPTALSSAAFKFNRMVFTSGNVGIDYENNTYKDSIQEQTIQAIENLKTTLAAAGSSLEEVIKVSLFISDIKYSTTVNEIYQKYFTSKPARYCVSVKFPNDKIKIELDCVAICAE
ncbi:uncharacterized protein PRCAT00003958001 [Priceomyces carsonii]|uniref:uncharacterized protein n=1 Tax=Priceomyces carsonii TaxID=28549 RepID=UPI002ED92BFC|nr:unnamed protein product [Priceomyces carsonii]